MADSLTIRGAAVDAALLDRKLSELAQRQEFSALNSKKFLLKMSGFWDMTVNELIARFGKEQVQGIINQYL